MSAAPEDPQHLGTPEHPDQMALFDVPDSDSPSNYTSDHAPVTGEALTSTFSVALERAARETTDYLDEYPDMFDPAVPGTRFHEIPEGHPKPKPMTPYRDAAGRPVSAMFDGAEVPTSEMRRELAKIREREEERQYHVHVTRGMVLHTIREIDAMENHARREYLKVLESYDALHGTGHVAAYASHAVTCTWRDPVSGVRCHSERKSRFDKVCAGHTLTQDLNWSNPVERNELEHRKMQARARMTGLLETATDKLVDILRQDEESISPAVMLQAIQTVFDRGGLPKETQTHIEATVEHTDNTAAAELVRERLAGLASGLGVTHDLGRVPVMANAPTSDDSSTDEKILEAEVVSDN